MHIISYKPLSGLNFAMYTELLHAVFPFEVYKPLINVLQYVGASKALRSVSMYTTMQVQLEAIVL